MSEENLYQRNYCNECGIPIDSDEYGSYCPMHRLDMNGCCRNHCLLSGGEGESHCIHCTPTNPALPCCQLCGRMINPDHEDLYCNACIENFSCENCGDDILPDEGPICELCTEYDYETDESVTATDAINYFHDLYQRLAPTTEEQTQRLAEIKVQLCEECKMPCEFIWCNDCSFD